MFEQEASIGAAHVAGAPNTTDDGVADGGMPARDASADDQARSGRWGDDDGSRSPRGRAKAQAVTKRGKRRAPTPRWGETGAPSDEDVREGLAKDAKPSKKTVIIVAAAGLGMAALAIGLIALSRERSAQAPSVEPASTAQPATSRPLPSANEEPAGFVAQPLPDQAAPAKPTSAAQVADSTPNHGRGEAAPDHASKPREWKNRVAEGELRPTAAAPAPQESPPRPGATPSEVDYRRADEAYQRGNARLFQGRTADAIKDFEEALSKNPKDPAIQRGLGLAYAQLGNATEAIKHLKSYLKGAPRANDRALVEKRIVQLQSQSELRAR
jgi:tetratricopeptide (TPR) repeat protein